MQTSLRSGTLNLAVRVVALIALLAVALGSPSHTVRVAAGATLTVDSDLDTDSAIDGVCTLREAILAAFGNSDHNECVNSGDPYGDD